MILRREMHPSSALRFKRREGQGFILLGIALHELLRLGAGNGLAAVFELRALQGQGIETLGVVLHAAAVKNAFDGQKRLAGHDMDCISCSMPQKQPPAR